MKRMFTMLTTFLIVVVCLTIHADALEMEVKSGDGYISLYERYENQLPEDWTWKDLWEANGKKVLVPGTLTIELADGGSERETDSKSERITMTVKKGDGYMALFWRYKEHLPAGWTWRDLWEANGKKVLTPGTLTIEFNDEGSEKDNVSKTERVTMTVKSGDGYISLFRRYKEHLPAGWTWKNLSMANGGKTLVPGTLTIYCSKGKMAASGTVLGECTLSNYSAGDESWHNIKVSAEKLNGQVIHSGETFDWLYKHVGRCTAAAGYIDAPVQPKGNGIGGGICFTSTVLYQAAVLNGPMKEIERHDHGEPVSYAVRGEECAIGYPVKNQRWENTTPYDVKIVTYISGKSLTIKLVVE